MAMAPRGTDAKKRSGPRPTSVTTTMRCADYHLFVVLHFRHTQQQPLPPPHTVWLGKGRSIRHPQQHQHPLSFGGSPLALESCLRVPLARVVSGKCRVVVEAWA